MTSRGMPSDDNGDCEERFFSSHPHTNNGIDTRSRMHWYVRKINLIWLKNNDTLI